MSSEVKEGEPKGQDESSGPNKRQKIDVSRSSVATSSSPSIVDSSSSIRGLPIPRPFSHGNSDRHYEYHVGRSVGRFGDKSIWNDPRVMCLPTPWLANKRVLDVGCNAGYVAISIAERYPVNSIVGVDIDGKLIKKARKLLKERHKLLETTAQARVRGQRLHTSQRGGVVDLIPAPDIDDENKDLGGNEETGEGTTAAEKDTPAKNDDDEGEKKAGGTSNGSLIVGPLDTEHETSDTEEGGPETEYPLSCHVVQGLSRGRLKQLAPYPGIQAFPFTVLFRREDFARVQDTHPSDHYDMIVCWRVTKWIHINGGDEAIRQVFRKFYRYLKKDGKLMLQPQQWTSYVKTAKKTPEVAEKLKTLKLRPEQFQRHLTHDIGFRRAELFLTGAQHHGILRHPIFVYTK